MWPISEGTNQDNENNTDVQFEEDFKDDLTGASRKEVESIVGAVRCGRFDKLLEGPLEGLINPMRSGTHEEEG